MDQWPHKKTPGLLSRLLGCLGLGLLIILAGCEGSPLGSSLQESLEADPQLQDNPQAAGALGSPAAGTPTPARETPAPEPGQPNFIGPVMPQGQTPSPSPTKSPQQSPDLAQAPAELQPYLRDLLALDLLPLPATGDSPSPGFQPNQVITRREYARWLMAVNNRFYADQTAKKIRAAVGSSAPVFQDVPANDPDFGAIQGLAEAGIIPSPLTGSSTVVAFRPDAPLTRKDLILWKVPLDTRQSLPSATAEAVQQSWGFQDANKIQAPALQAVLADNQLGEFANIRRALGYTTLFQPDKGVTRAEAAAVLWRFGNATEGITAESLLQPNPGN